jgi:hypothetical protein
VRWSLFLAREAYAIRYVGRVRGSGSANQCAAVHMCSSVIHPTSHRCVFARLPFKVIEPLGRLATLASNPRGAVGCHKSKKGTWKPERPSVGFRQLQSRLLRETPRDSFLPQLPLICPKQSYPSDPSL